MPRKLTITAPTIFSPSHKAQMVSEGESHGRPQEGPQTPGVDLLANTIDGHERPTLLHLGPTKTSAKDLHVRSALALSALKKSLVANLSAKRQLSVAKLSAKRIFFTRQTGFFSRKWPDGGRFFEP